MKRPYTLPDVVAEGDILVSARLTLRLPAHRVAETLEAQEPEDEAAAKHIVKNWAHEELPYLLDSYPIGHDVEVDW